MSIGVSLVNMVRIIVPTIAVVLLVLFTRLSSKAQSVVSEIEMTDVLRMQQLLDSSENPARSFFIRSSFLYQDRIIKPNSFKVRPRAGIIHTGYTVQNNTDLPITENDGSLLPAIGMQQRASIGAYFKWHFLSIQLQPEWVVAENLAPAPFTRDPLDNNYLSRYYHFIVNKIDLFERIGTERLETFHWGQSNIRINFKNFSTGISSENLWWGPGRRNSLVMTNTAPGFLHYTFQTRQPWKTPIGNIEFQAVYGQLDNPRFESPDHAMMRTFWEGGILQKPTARRHMWGYAFSWNPKWIPGLHIGAAGTEQFYIDSVGVEPTFLILDAENKPGIQRLGALFARYAMPKEQAEVYFEYGRANQFASPFNIWSDTIPTGYVLGARKLFPVRIMGKSHIEIAGEITQLQLPDARLIFNTENVFSLPRTNSWYTHPFMTQGYTHDAQALGASIGPGSNAQRLDISWVQGYKRISFFGERVSRNTDFNYYNYLTGNLGNANADRQWVDLHFGFQARWDWGPFLFSGSIQRTHTLNYRWVKLEGGFSDPSPSSDRQNTRVQLSVMYQMKRKG